MTLLRAAQYLWLKGEGDHKSFLRAGVRGIAQRGGEHFWPARGQRHGSSLPTSSSRKASQGHWPDRLSRENSWDSECGGPKGPSDTLGLQERLCCHPKEQQRQPAPALCPQRSREQLSPRFTKYLPKLTDKHL